jgi:hypothetical protein
MARGIDFRGVSSVINYDFPQTTQEYIHRIGTPRLTLVSYYDAAHTMTHDTITRLTWSMSFVGWWWWWW